jgi:anti-anti-sigma factor
MNIFSCSVDVDDRCAVAHLNGEVDMSTVSRLVEPLGPLATAGRDVVVDFSGIDFFGTAGLTALADLQRRATAAGVRSAVFSAPLGRERGNPDSAIWMPDNAIWVRGRLPDI